MNNARRLRKTAGEIDSRIKRDRQLITDITGAALLTCLHSTVRNVRRRYFAIRDPAKVPVRDLRTALKPPAVPTRSSRLPPFFFPRHIERSVRIASARGGRWVEIIYTLPRCTMARPIPGQSALTVRSFKATEPNQYRRERNACMPCSYRAGAVNLPICAREN